MGRPTISKAEGQKRRRKRFALMTVLLFVILFVVSLCISFFFSGAADASGSKTQPIFTYDEPTETKNSEETEPTENMTEPQTELSEVETTESTENMKDYTDNDLFYLAAAVCREAGGESEEIQLLVANVIINRVNSSIYPNTIYEVLTQYMQYGTMWKDGISFPDWADDNVKEQCYSVAQRILEGERYCPEDVLFQAEFPQGSGIYKQFGDDYYFCYYG